MCTLTYIPQGEGTFLAGSNRDESPLRERAEAPAWHETEAGPLVFPRDGRAGGSWLAASARGDMACLLNGAFGRHPMGGSYRKSRGLILLESFGYPDLRTFREACDLDGIEPFTIVRIPSPVVGDVPIGELRWDGKQAHLRELDPQMPHIWSSAQLYRTEVIERREQWFRAWLEEKAHPAAIHPQELEAFHHFGGEGDKYNDLRMNRAGIVQTVSTTILTAERQALSFRHLDHLHGEEKEVKIPF